MKRRIGADPLAQALVDEGLVPPNCRKVEVLARPRSALVIRYEVFVDAEDLVKLGRACKSVGDKFLVPTS